MKQPSVVKHHPLYQQSWKAFFLKSWKVLPALLVLALLLVLGHDQAQAATHHSTTHTSLYCNFSTYALTSRTSFERATGEVVTLQPSNLNYYAAVDIWHGDFYQGRYYLPEYDWNVGYGYELQIYSYGGSDWVNACTNWVSI